LFKPDADETYVIGASYTSTKQNCIKSIPDLPTPITCKSGGFEKQAQKNLEIRTLNLETLKMCVT